MKEWRCWVKELRCWVKELMNEGIKVSLTKPEAYLGLEML